MVLKDGREFTANTILSNADPKRTFLQMFDELDLPESLVKDVKKMRFASGAVKFNIAAKALPDFYAYPGSDSRSAASRHDPHFAVDGVHRESLRTGQVGRAVVGAVHRDGHSERRRSDDRAAGQALHLLLRAVRSVHPRRRSAVGSDRRKREFVANIAGAIRPFCSNWDDVVEDYQILTPPKIEERFGLTGGNIFQGELTPDQSYHMRPVPSCARYSTPITGFYLCGAGTHPGGGVFGAPGYLAAKAVLRERSR